MLLVFKNIIKILPIVKLEIYKNELSVWIPASLLINVLILLKTHYKSQLKILTCISGVDSPKNSYRFIIVYELLCIKYNFRLKVKILLNDLLSVTSCEKVFTCASWWESEIWDMFGIFFFKHNNLTRLLTDYGFQGHPLKKDFPLGGFNESRYNIIKNRVLSENIELTQEYRIFNFISPWENFYQK